MNTDTLAMEMLTISNGESEQTLQSCLAGNIMTLLYRNADSIVACFCDPNGSLKVIPRTTYL